MQENDFIRKTWAFLLVGFLYIFVGLSLEKFYGSEQLHLIFNAYNAPWADFFFKYYTQTGEIFFLLIVLIFIIKKLRYKELLIFIMSFIVQAILVQIIKKGFYIHHLRPGFYFQEKGIDIHWVEGVKQGITYSYPSGHSATIFMVFLFLAITYKNRWVQMGLGFAAALGAYSRIYLSQHYMIDTIGGAFIGVFAVILAYYLISFQDSNKLNQYVIKRNK